jgi:hypothetical protein
MAWIVGMADEDDSEKAGRERKDKQKRKETNKS